MPMQYQRLTLEQLEALHQEFAHFLAVHGIDKPHWDDIKASQPERVESLLDDFSDVIWEAVLQQTRYLIHYAEHFLFVFHCQDDLFESIVVKVTAPDIDLTQASGLAWLENHWLDNAVEIRIGRKSYAAPRAQEMFALIQQGAQLHDGQIYLQLHRLIHPH